MNYSENFYHHFDQRTLADKEQQHQVVESIVANNIKTLKIQLTPKSKVHYKPRERQKVDLGGQWYCYITDNKKVSRHSFLTLHGAPGDHVEWAGLQTEMGQTFRWINLTFPGFDGQDERRGQYDGSMHHVSLLILRLLKQLKIQKAIFCAHSLGSIFCSYFIPRYPQVVEGYANVTGIVDHWYVGLMTFYQITIGGCSYNSKEWRARQLHNDDRYRQQIHKTFLEMTEGKSFGPVQFPKLTLTEYFAYIKMINTAPNGLSQLYNNNRNLTTFRVLFFGKNDPLHAWDTTEASIYNLCRGSSYLKLPYYQQLFTLAKQQVEKRLKEEYGVEIEGEKLQEYFCFHLEETGHNFHKRRPVEMSRILKIYVACIQVLQQCEWALKQKI